MCFETLYPVEDGLIIIRSTIIRSNHLHCINPSYWRDHAASFVEDSDELDTVFTLAHREAFEGNAFVSVGLSVCLSGRVTQKLLLRLTLFFYAISIMPVAQFSSNKNYDPDLNPRIYSRILHRWEMEQHMPSKYATIRKIACCRNSLFIQQTLFECAVSFCFRQINMTNSIASWNSFLS